MKTKLFSITTVILALALLGSACAPSQAAIEKAIQQTQAAAAPLPTQNNTPTNACEIVETDRAEWSVSVCEQFSNEGSDPIGIGEWDSKLTHMEGSVEEGIYRVDAQFKPYGNFTRAATFWVDLDNHEGDYLLQIDGSMDSVNKYVYWGIGMRGKTDSDFYGLFIDKFGGFFVSRLTEDGWKGVADYKTNREINQGNKVNTLKAIAEGSEVTFFANGEELITIESDSAKAPYMFLILSGDEGTKIDYEFDNLLIKYK